MLTALVFLTSLAHGAALDPSWKFKVFRSPHFEMVYREDQKDLAKRYIIAAEQAHELLMPIFKEGPKKTIIVIMDGTDASNGLANFLPYPHIIVYPVLPSSLDSVDEYGDWPLEMMLHEYTHILNMYPAHGIYVPLKWIFGSVVRPNAVLPKWYLEGLAVDMESWLSDHGRLRSTETLASMRALNLGGKFKNEDVATINEGELSRWPYGGRPYLFGAWFWEDLHRTKGTDLVYTWNQNFSRRLPFLLNGPMKEQTGKTAHELVVARNEALDALGKKQVDQIGASGPHKSDSVVEEKGEQTVFALSPSGNKLVYFVGTPKQGSTVRLKTRANEKQRFKDISGKTIFKAVAPLRARWIGEDRFIYDQIDTFYPYGSYRDLYYYDLETKKTNRLTVHQRAQEPAVSPNGRYVAYIQNDGGKNRLNLFDLEKQTSRTLVNGNMNQRLSMPEYLSSNEIVFSVLQRNGSERLHVYSLSTGKTLSWGPAELTNAQNARLTSEGLLVTDAGTNVRNVYLIKDGKAQAVSNTYTDIQTADLDPQRDELIVSELTPDGRRLRTFPFSVYSPPKLEKTAIAQPPKPPALKVKLKEESYVPVAYMLPRYWIPFIYQVEEGFIFQGITSNQDPAGRNEYSILGAYDTVTKKPSYGFSYINHSLPTDIGLGYSKSVSYLGASDLVLESESGAINFANYWPFNTRNIKWSLGMIWDTTESSTTTYKRMGPDLNWTYSRMSNPLNEHWGTHLELAHQEYLEQGDNLHYGRTYVHFAQAYTSDSGRKVVLNTRGSLAPELPHGGPVIALGDRNVGGNYLVNLANSQFLLRGYPSGTFVGRKMASLNLEYVLPAMTMEKGFGTFPFYLRNMELAAFVDTLAVDGAAFNSEEERYKFSTLGEFYTSAGTELRVNTTTGYHLPLSLTIGLYYGFNDKYGGGFTPFFGIGFGTLSALENKTP